MSLADFHALEPHELIAALHAKKEHDRSGWEQARMVMWAALAPHQAKGARLKPTDVMSFPWDDEAAIRNLPPPETPEQIAARKALHARWDAEVKRNHQENQTNGSR